MCVGEGGTSELGYVPCRCQMRFPVFCELDSGNRGVLVLAAFICLKRFHGMVPLSLPHSLSLGFPS